MNLIVPSIRNEKFQLYLEKHAVTLEGTIDMQFPKETVGVFLKTLHQELLKHKSKFITLDITGLLFINSSGIREFLAWLLSITMLNTSQKYEIFLIINQEIHYQVSLAKSFVMLYPSVKLFGKEKNNLSIKNL